jgi:hypothetical protein
LIAQIITQNVSFLFHRRVVVDHLPRPFLPRGTTIGGGRSGWFDPATPRIGLPNIGVRARAINAAASGDCAVRGDGSGLLGRFGI